MFGLQPLRKGDRREAAMTVASVAIVIVLIVGFAAVEMVRTYDATLRLGRVRSANLALVLEEQTRRTVQALDFSLLTVVDALRRDPGIPSHDPTMTGQLRARLAQLPFVRALFVVGADGFLIQDTDSDTPNVSLADRDYFRAQASDAGAGLSIGEPLRSRSLGAPWFLSVSRRVTLDDGRFYGVVVAALEPKYFAHLYAGINAGKNGSIALIYRSGMLIARYPEHENGIGLSLANEKLFTGLPPAAAAGTYTETSKVDGVERLYGYRLVAPLPLVVAVGLSKASLLADWRVEASLAGGVTLALVVLMSAGTALFLRRRARDLRAAERLQQIEKTEAIAQMTSSVAHDFNNLLAVIIGNLELVAARLPADSPSTQKLGVALDAAERGERVVGQLLTFARQQPFVAAHESPAALIAGMSALLRQAARPCELRVEAAAGMWGCDIDKGQFERAMMNLVVNARDAMPHGGIVAVSMFNVPRRSLDRVTWRVTWPDLIPGDYIGCSLRDHGAGMAPDVLRHACEPFFTTKSDGRGTGLGLSQVFGFARQSGGGVHIRSEVGAGTVVTLLLPRSAPPAQLPARAGAGRPR
jgi:two-component system, NtrC family, sensor kinase